MLCTPIGAIISASSASGERIAENDDFMKKKPNNGMRDEYDFAHGRRGKYAKRYAEGTNVVVLAPDVARIFSTSKKVNSSRKLIRAEAST